MQKSFAADVDRGFVVPFEDCGFSAKKKKKNYNNQFCWLLFKSLIRLLIIDKIDTNTYRDRG